MGESFRRDYVDTRRYVEEGLVWFANIFWPCQPALITRFSRCATMPPPPSRCFDLESNWCFCEEMAKKEVRLCELSPESRNPRRTSFAGSPDTFSPHAKCNYQRRRNPFILSLLSSRFLCSRGWGTWYNVLRHNRKWYNGIGHNLGKGNQA